MFGSGILGDLFLVLWFEVVDGLLSFGKVAVCGAGFGCDLWLLLVVLFGNDNEGEGELVVLVPSFSEAGDAGGDEGDLGES